MICFPNAKINIGLRILEKRPDGYHNIESVFYPVGWCDALEVIKTEGFGKIELHLSGIPVPGRTDDDNLCVKLYKLLLERFKMPSLKVWLHKAIPIGAGLGGGSSDAAHFMKMLNELCELSLSEEEMKAYVAKLGSDCVFFIENKPVIAYERGEKTEPITLELAKYYCVLVYPEIMVSTPLAYSLVAPKPCKDSLKEVVLNNKPSSWKDCVVNDFEEPLFAKFPVIKEVKNKLYSNGAVYAAMTGSGSAVYGIFEKRIDASVLFPNYKTWSGPFTLNK